MSRVYILIMRRWGNTEDHQYVDGIYTCLAKACIEGLEHERFRDSKYEPFIQECYIDSGKKLLEISRETAIDYAIMKYPEKFNDQRRLKDE